MNSNIQYYRSLIENEMIYNLDFNYLKDAINSWWQDANQNIPIHILKFSFINFLLKKINEKDLYYFDKVGVNGIAGVCIANIFNEHNHKLALLVHEALSDLFSLNDIKYPYEEHKALYLKATGEDYKNWGNGYGEITPHSDDLYEDLDVDYLSLTICKDITETPTTVYLLKDILKNFTDVELSTLFNVRARFISGKNVQIIKEQERNLLEYNEKEGLKFYLDFREDKITGIRMNPLSDEGLYLINKMKSNILVGPSAKIYPQVGTFLIIANHKALHSRAQLNLDRKLALELSSNNDILNAPRLLFRSKGPKKTYIIFLNWSDS